ncbi:hypothetical protein ST47_g7762 [Ascochyta rabiei]|uniref:Uncharacterized protein n=1 Tax=Didymella rabiei TaxID=5454 RepID=A0A163ABJ5_DIDRA|nr:hypothetical protein ST47_g7762 [Ascochyta rabiei]
MLSGGFGLASMLKARIVHVLGIKSSDEEEEYICGSLIYSNAASEYVEDLDNEKMIKRQGIVCNPDEDVWAKWKKHEGSSRVQCDWDLEHGCGFGPGYRNDTPQCGL